jgi:biopolymer transport protein ExbD
MARKHSATEAIQDINIVPFVDIVLVLLVILMMTAPTLYQSAIRIQLPEAFQATGSSKVTLRFFIDQSGNLFLDQRKIQVEELDGYLQQALAIDPGTDALFSADERVPHGSVIKIVNRLRSLGIRDVAFGVKAEGRE